jgi:ActR/RegA family two-component response regulator
MNTWSSGQQKHEQAGRSVLVVDDEDVFRRRLVRAFSDRGFEAAGIGSTEEDHSHFEHGF